MKKTLLVLDSSARTNRSITRSLTARLTERWRGRWQSAEVIHRDLGRNPPQAISEAWIGAAFGKPVEGPSPLAESDELIDELFRADAIAIGVPMYNFGMPAALKAYLDQIVRVGRTFDFRAEAENPYLPLIPSKPVVAVASMGAGGFEPGGEMANLNFLEPHLATVLGFVGLDRFSVVRAQYEEFKDERWRLSVAAAEMAVDAWVDGLEV
ncbi:NAD(P)H-dependent oxidoreductase [Luteolibacter ambystomatis]|uniref:FMN dependent NADH:quinone oxidoreductase n=1 Tax=Luteolibacter ambystomatis TaxID=2824561 RepID=A0A975PG58_9BACT|nr:NAD(P)H-dependent oxidoreductase [Luteolibacter ambystomatis]QUE52032.1 NAD(P)H-dependent oxidoreductase [Luteolibacter ambystomatis]